jgi:Holliday junction resolvase RusA-like endonuclease
MVQEATFVIPGRLSGANELKKAHNIHWAVAAKLRREELKLCMNEVMRQNIMQKAHFWKPVMVSFAWIEPNAKRDLDNITGGQKVILDALVECRVLQNDTQEWVKSLIHKFPGTDKDNPKIIVHVQEVFDGESTSSPVKASDGSASWPAIEDQSGNLL